MKLNTKLTLKNSVILYTSFKNGPLKELWKDIMYWPVVPQAVVNHCQPNSLDYFHSKGKKRFIAHPSKSLSNQKFSDFTQKYPHVSVGIITGDIRCNPDADVLVMTTEILLNKLYQIKSKDNNIANIAYSSISFEMDIENELGCVVFDEIHYIANEDRGHVWENSIMMLPKHVQMIGLSATLDDPVKFSYWLENRGEVNTSDKIVYLTAKHIRAVPLIHYSFITVPQGIFKAVKDKSVQAEIKISLTNHL